MTKSRGIRKPRLQFTPEQLDAIRTRYPHERTANIATDIGMKVEQVYHKAAALKLCKTAEYLASPDACRLRRGDNVGMEYRWKKGQVSHNKGKKGISYEGCIATQFKKGQLSGRAAEIIQPIGAERISKDGYIQRKINNDLPFQKRWRAVHTIIWEKLNGPLPKGHAIVFKDSNKRNFDPSNLDCISRAELMRRNTVHNYPKEIALLVQLSGAVKRQINRRLKNEQSGK